jgi:hypothetical protein
VLRGRRPHRNLISCFWQCEEGGQGPETRGRSLLPSDVSFHHPPFVIKNEDDNHLSF